jgi:type 1 glutamine amidotransferase
MQMKILTLIFTLSVTNALAETPSSPAEGNTATQTAPVPYVKDPKHWPTPVMDQQAPALPKFHKRHAVLVFGKTNGYRDDEQNVAANAALNEIVAGKSRDVFITENAATFNPKQLKQFDVVVLNSISGNVFLPEQREAFKHWIESGGGVVALHGSGGDHHYDWQWYVEVMLGAQFIGHTNSPNQFQPGVIRIQDRKHPATVDIPVEWQRTEEWYSFDHIPTGYHTHILAVLDESTYHPEPKQVMGTHPIIWTRCIGRGRVFFSALGHKAETYAEPLHLKLISGAIDWASQAHNKGCE